MYIGMCVRMCVCAYVCTYVGMSVCMYGKAKPNIFIFRHWIDLQNGGQLLSDGQVYIHGTKKTSWTLLAEMDRLARRWKKQFFEGLAGWE